MRWCVDPGIDVPHTGNGVILVVVDSGLDFHHPDFITVVDGQPKSRLLFFWDTMTEQTENVKTAMVPPVCYPNGIPIGTIYTQAQLSAVLRGEGVMPTWDTLGHGTACASIAAGNGRAAPANLKKDHVGVGVAPEVDLIAVRIGGAQGGFKHFFLLGAICEWADAIARQRNQPYVVSCSFGAPLGSHDGNRVDERQLDAHFPPDAPGRAICISAGNDGDLDRHAAIEFADKATPGKLTWKCDTPNTRLVIYYDNAKAGDLAFDKQDVGDIKTYIHPLTGGVVTEANIISTKSWAPGALTVWSNSGAKIQADAYLQGGVAYFTGPCVRYGKQIGTPASSKNAIAVGSYDWNSGFRRYGRFLDYSVNKGRNYTNALKPLRGGELSAYSNPGPSRTGQVRPDVVAPGQWHIAAAAGNIDAVEAYRDTSGRYRLFNGTSAACPYTAGVVALMMQKNRKISLDQIRELFRAKLTGDDITGPVPNPGWGNGRLNSEAVQAILKAIP